MSPAGFNPKTRPADAALDARITDIEAHCERRGDLTFNFLDALTEKQIATGIKAERTEAYLDTFSAAVVDDFDAVDQELDAVDQRLVAVEAAIPAIETRLAASNIGLDGATQQARSAAARTDRLDAWREVLTKDMRTAEITIVDLTAAGQTTSIIAVVAFLMALGEMVWLVVR
jgi:hypothetical protein